MINIETVTKTQNYNQLMIGHVNIDLTNDEQYGRVNYALLNDDTRFNEQVIFTKDELKDWGEDDAVLLGLVAQKLGVTLQSDITGITK
jgi:hypothetical protein